MKTFGLALILFASLITIAYRSAFSSTFPLTFRPDGTFTGSSLTEWRSSGSATWKAADGEIIGTPSKAGGGWLLLNKSFQDVSFYVDFLCQGDCKPGLLLRAEKTTAGGFRGIFVSLVPSDAVPYFVELNSNGVEIQRTKLPNPPPPLVNASGSGRGAPGAVAGSPAPVLGAGAGAPTIGQLDLPTLTRRTLSIEPGKWNSVEVLLSGTTLRVLGGVAAGGADLSLAAYGPIGLYAGGTTEVRYRNISFQDLLTTPAPPEIVSSNYRMQRLNGMFHSWGAAVGDFNRDGVPDVVAGAYYYLGPDYSVAHALYQPMPYNPGTEYPQESMVTLVSDFTGDGWDDVFAAAGSAGKGVGVLYVNPRGESRTWQRRIVLPEVGNEDTVLDDIDGDGKLEIIHAGNNRLQYSRPDPANPSGIWITKSISAPGPWGVGIGHGLGTGDINGDGRKDFLNVYGWWEQPAKGSEELWKYHPQAFGRWGPSAGGAGGAQIGVFDVNGDGLNDVVTPMEGHGMGLGWYEQVRHGTDISFIEHSIVNNFQTKNAGDVMFSQPHGAAYADMNGDGIPDLITGKRVMSHLFYIFGDPDPFGPAVLYVFKTVRNKNAPGGAEFVPELVHNQSGVGSHFAVTDLNKDGRPDIVTTGAYGTFIFFNNTPKPTQSAR